VALLGVSDQGGGCPVPGEEQLWPGVSNISAGPLGGNLSHYARFAQVAAGRAYGPADHVAGPGFPPTGRNVSTDWAHVYARILFGTSGRGALVRGLVGLADCLTPQQRAVVELRRGAVLVQGPAGSGKSTAACERVARLARAGESGHGSGILALTPSPGGAEQLQAALDERLPLAQHSRCEVRCFHGLGAAIAAAHAHELAPWEAAALGSGAPRGGGLLQGSRLALFVQQHIFGFPRRAGPRRHTGAGGAAAPHSSRRGRSRSRAVAPCRVLRHAGRHAGDAAAARGAERGGGGTQATTAAPARGRAPRRGIRRRGRGHWCCSATRAALWTATRRWGAWAGRTAQR